jgi:hypothetical protein
MLSYLDSSSLIAWSEPFSESSGSSKAEKLKLNRLFVVFLKEN